MREAIRHPRVRFWSLLTVVAALGMVFGGSALAPGHSKTSKKPTSKTRHIALTKPDFGQNKTLLTTKHFNVIGRCIDSYSGGVANIDVNPGDHVAVVIVKKRDSKPAVVDALAPDLDAEDENGTDPSDVNYDDHEFTSGEIAPIVVANTTGSNNDISGLDRAYAVAGDGRGVEFNNLYAGIAVPGNPGGCTFGGTVQLTK